MFYNLDNIYLVLLMYNSSIKVLTFFFLRKKLAYFINLKQLHLNLKSKQYATGHLPSIFENLVCIMHFSPDYEQPYCRFS